MSRHSNSLKINHVFVALAIIAVSFVALQFGPDNHLTGAVTGTGNSTGSVLPIIESITINSTIPTQNSTYDNITHHIVSNGNKDIFNWYLNQSSISVLNLPFEKTDDTNSDNNQDYSPNNHTVTEQGSIVWNAMGGFDGNGSYEFDGLNDYLTIPDHNSLDFGSDEFAYAFWTKVNSDTGTIQQFISKRLGSGENYELQLESTGLLRAYAGQVGSSTYVDSTTDFLSNLGVWYHIAVVREAGNLKLYVNGILENSTASSHNVDSTSILSIGRDPVGASEYFNGTIDDLQFFNASLAPKQVEAMYQNKTFIVANQTNIADYWHFCATPNGNGVDGVTNCSSQIEVTNVIPQITSAQVTSTTPTINSTYDNVSTSISSTDPNNDPIKHFINWQLNGSETVALNLPFEKIDRSDINNARDYSIYSNDGSEQGSIVWNETGGFDSNGAYQFDGVDDYILVSDSNSLDIQNELTLLAWVKPSRAGHGDWETIIMKGTDQTLANRNFRYNLRITDAGKAQFSVNTVSDYYSISSTATVQNDTWSLLAGVYNGSDVEVFINGLSEGSSSASGAISTSTDDIRIGHINNDEYLGAIDDLNILNIKLTANQVQSVYQNNFTIITSSQTHQADNWSFCVTPNDGWNDGTTQCSENITVNSIPTVPSPILPTNDSSRTNRSVYFSWNSSVSGDEDAVTYQLQISNETDFSNIILDQLGVVDNATVESNYTHFQDLPTDTTFYWKLRATDGKEESLWSEYYQFQVLSSNVVTLPTSSVDFGEVSSEQDTNTTQGSGLQPLLISNDGNIDLDIYLNSTLMFSHIDSLWQYQIEENETTSYLSANESWTNFTMDLSDVLSIKNLYFENNSNSANRANLHVLADVSSSEPGGAKSSTIYIRSEASP